MKIALVILRADPTRGGAERYTTDLAAALAKRGHEVSLLSTEFADPPAGAKLVELPAHAVTRGGRYRRMLDSLDAHLAGNTYDIVHAMLPVRRCDIYHPHAGLAVGAVAAKPLQAIFNPRRRGMARIERGLLESPNPPTVLCLSDYVKQEIIRQYPALPPERLESLFNAVSLEHFDPELDHGASALRRSLGIGERNVVALIVAQDFERKGVPQAIAAVQRINAAAQNGQPKLKLLIVGDGPQSESDPHILYAGRQSAISRFYSAADFFVLPTRHDPCSLVVLEALAMGLPVISTRFNGACEVMADGVHGYVLPNPSDVSALADAMRRLLDRETRARMSASCRELRPLLSYERHLDRLVRIYQRRLTAPRVTG